MLYYLIFIYSKCINRVECSIFVQVDSVFVLFKERNISLYYKTIFLLIRKIHLFFSCSNFLFLIRTLLQS